MEKGYYDLES
nr:RecName: Full=62 kDa cell wall protein [Solanum lycopersicum]